MTTKQCLEDLIKYLEGLDYISSKKKAELIATLHRGPGDSS
ncbi:unnamed protein product [marine sediment metagenome]|uniref:Uncharacterized protein n=1 Tax=marine sediment metagenome TaxID=412755 RepID=X1VKR2_9ZZZZ